MRSVFALAVLSVLSLGCLDFPAAVQNCQASGVCEQPPPPPDAPVLELSNPGVAAQGVPVDTAFSFTFSKAMERPTLTITPQVATSSGTAVAQGTTWVFVPTAPLAHATAYAIRVSGTSTDGAALAPEPVVTFTTVAAPDSTPPSIVSTIPTAGANTVSSDSVLRLVFNEPMQPDSLQLTSNPTHAWGAPTWSAGGAQVDFLAPPAPLEGATTYQLSFSARDLSGNALTGITTLSFSTAVPPDTTPPQVLNASPVPGSTNVTPAANISLEFSEAMAQSATQGAVTVTPSVPCAWTWDTAGRLLTCTHPGQPNLATNTLHRVQVTTAAQDLAGNALASPDGGAAFEFTFTTGLVPDTTPPTVVSASPADGGTGVLPTANIVVAFSEPMDKAATQTAFAVSSPASVTGTFSWNSAGTTMTFNPNLDFGVNSAGLVVQWQVGTGARDLAGNALPVVHAQTFRVARSMSARLPAMSAEDGYCRSDGYCYALSNQEFVGESSSCTNCYTRAILAFDMAGLYSAGVVRIDTAELFVKQAYASTDNPYTSLGSVCAHAIDAAGGLDSTDFNSTPIQVLDLCVQGNCATCAPTGYVLSTTNVLEQKRVAVVEAVREAAGFCPTTIGCGSRRQRVNFRLQFTTNFGGASGVQLARFHSGDATVASDKPYVDVTFLAP